MPKPTKWLNIVLTDSAESFTTGFSMLIVGRESWFFLSPQNLYYNHSVLGVWQKFIYKMFNVTLRILSRMRYAMRNEIDEKFSKSSQTRTAHALKWQWPAGFVCVRLVLPPLFFFFCLRYAREYMVVVHCFWNKSPRTTAGNWHFSGTLRLIETKFVTHGMWQGNADRFSIVYLLESQQIHSLRRYSIYE